MIEGKQPRRPVWKTGAFDLNGSQFKNGKARHMSKLISNENLSPMVREIINQKEGGYGT